MGPEKVETETMRDEDELQWNIVFSGVRGGQEGEAEGFQSCWEGRESRFKVGGDGGGRWI